jgi:hypothetical protein
MWKLNNSNPTFSAAADTCLIPMFCTGYSNNFEMKVIFNFSIVFTVVVYVNMPTCEKGNVLCMTTSMCEICQICLPAGHKEIGNLTCNSAHSFPVARHASVVKFMWQPKIPHKRSPLPIELEGAMTSVSAWTLCRREKILPLPGNKTRIHAIKALSWTINI